MKYRKISPDKISVAAAYQREMRSAMVGLIVKHFESDAFGVLVIGERTDGSLWCVDGQTRLKAAIKLGMLEVPCLVFESRGKEHEAQLFRLLNTQTNQTKLQRLKAQVCEGDPTSIELIATVERHGFKIGFDNHRTWPHIRAIGPIERAFQLGVLDRVLAIINNAWGAAEDTQALQVPITGGLTRMLAQHGDVIDDEELAARLSHYSVSQLVGQCEARKMQGGSREDAMREVLVNVWNVKRRVRKIE